MQNAKFKIEARKWRGIALLWLLILHFAFLILHSAALAQTAPAASPAAAQGKEKQNLLWQKLQSAVEQSDHELDGVLAVAVTDLSSGRKLAWHADEVMPTASSIKIAVLAELYRQHQQAINPTAPKAGTAGAPSAAGDASAKPARLTDPYTVNAADLVPDSDIMGGLTPGVTRLTLRDVATMMIAVSDNSATNVLIDRVGMENVNRMLVEQGLSATRLRRKMMDLKAAGEGRENVASPRELAELLENIWRGKLLNPELTADFFKMLGTHKDSAFVRALPDGVRTADKPCELEGVRNDCGVIYATNRPFILCAMTTYDARERHASEIIGRLALQAWSLFDRMGRASDYGRVISPGNSSPPR